MIGVHHRTRGAPAAWRCGTASPRDLRQVLDLEVDAAPRTHVERAKSEIDGVGARVDGCLQTCEVSGRSKNLRFYHQGVLYHGHRQSDKYHFLSTKRLVGVSKKC